MKYRCLFIYQSLKFFGSAFTTIDMILDEKISSQNIKSVETEGKKIIELNQGCEVSNFLIAAWSELIDTEGGIE